MTSDELAAFIAEVRAQVGAIRTRLTAVNRDELPPALRAMHDDVQRQSDELLAFTDAEAVALLEAACAQAGRELTPKELRGFFRSQ
jgi:hypothetical protein